MGVPDITDKIRGICTRLLETPLDSAEAAQYQSELKSATAELVGQETEWDKTSERDTHQIEARQPYRSREKDSADAFAEGLKLFDPRKRDSEKKKQG